MWAGPEVYEGTWEELSSHAAEFAGRRLRLTVLSAPPPVQSPHEQRAFLRLPLAERRRLLAEQAERMRTYYEANGEWREWLQGDIVEY